MAVVAVVHDPLVAARGAGALEEETHGELVAPLHVREPLHLDARGAVEARGLAEARLGCAIGFRALPLAVAAHSRAVSRRLGVEAVVALKAPRRDGRWRRRRRVHDRAPAVLRDLGLQDRARVHAHLVDEAVEVLSRRARAGLANVQRVVHRRQVTGVAGRVLGLDAVEVEVELGAVVRHGHVVPRVEPGRERHVVPRLGVPHSGQAAAQHGAPALAPHAHLERAVAIVAVVDDPLVAARGAGALEPARDAEAAAPLHASVVLEHNARTAVKPRGHAHCRGLRCGVCLVALPLAVAPVPALILHNASLRGGGRLEAVVALDAARRGGGRRRRRRDDDLAVALRRDLLLSHLALVDTHIVDHALEVLGGTAHARLPDDHGVVLLLQRPAILGGPVLLRAVEVEV